MTTATNFPSLNNMRFRGPVGESDVFCAVGVIVDASKNELRCTKPFGFLPNGNTDQLLGFMRRDTHDEIHSIHEREGRFDKYFRFKICVSASCITWSVGNKSLEVLDVSSPGKVRFWMMLRLSGSKRSGFLLNPEQSYAGPEGM